MAVDPFRGCVFSLAGQRRAETINGLHYSYNVWCKEAHATAVMNDNWAWGRLGSPRPRVFILHKAIMDAL